MPWKRRAIETRNAQLFSNLNCLIPELNHLPQCNELDSFYTLASQLLEMIHLDPVFVCTARWKAKSHGLTERPPALDLEGLRKVFRRTITASHECSDAKAEDQLPNI